MFFIRAIGIPMGVSEFQWDVLSQKPLEFPYPLGFHGGAEFQWGMGNPMGYWNSNGPIGIPRMDLIATQRSGGLMCDVSCARFNVSHVTIHILIAYSPGPATVHLVIRMEMLS